MATISAHINKRQLPSDMDQVWTVTRLELKRNLRRKRFVAFLIIIALVVSLILAIPPAAGIDYAKLGAYQFAQIFTEFASFLIILLAVFFAGDSLVSEFHSKTGYSLFPNPVKRSSIFVGKILASLLGCILILGIYYILMAASVGIIFHQMPLEIALSFGFAVLYAAAAVGVSYLFGSLMKTTASATVLTFVFFLFILQMLSAVFMVAGMRADPLLTYEAGVINAVLAGPFPEAYPQDMSDPRMPFKIFQPKVDIAIVVMLIWMIVTLVLAYFFFRRREMLG